MAYRLEEDREQFHGASSTSSASPEVQGLDSTPKVEEFEQQTALAIKKEHNGQPEEAIAHNHIEATLPASGKEQRELLEEAFLDSLLEPEESVEDFLSTPPKKSSQRRSLIPLLLGTGIGIALTVVGMGLLPTLNSKSGSPVAPAKESLAPSLSVTVAPVETTTVSKTLNATGTVAAFDLLPVLPRASGLQIKQVLAEEGDIVKEGQILAVLDNSVLQTQLQQAKAQLESSQAVVGQKQAALAQSRATLAQSQRELARYQYLANQGAVNRQDLDTRTTTVATNQQAVQVAIANIGSAQADVRNSQAKIQELQTQIEQTLVRAPANGIIAEKNARVGDVSATFQAQKLFSLIRDRHLELQLKVPETQLPQVQVGAPVTVTSNADRRLRIQGKVRDISPLVDQQTRQATVKVDLPPSSYQDFQLRPGMFLQGAIVANTAQGLAVPATAVLPQSDGKATVYLLNQDNTVKAQAVEVGVTTNPSNTQESDPSKARIEIKRGLKLGDRVVVDGAGYLKDGDRVKVVN